jgi:hypothetical protein
VVLLPERLTTKEYVKSAPDIVPDMVAVPADTFSENDPPLIEHSKTG